MIEVMLAHHAHGAPAVGPKLGAPTASGPITLSAHESAVDAALMVAQLPTGAWAIMNRVAMKHIAERVRGRGARRRARAECTAVGGPRSTRH